MAATRDLTFDVDELSGAVILGTKDKRDGLARKLPLLEACEKVHGKGSPSKDGGEKWAQPLEAFEHSIATDMPTGYEEINLDVVSTDRTFIFTPAHVNAPILISQREKNAYHGKAALFDRAVDRSNNVLNAMMRNWHKHALQGGVPGFSSWATLNGVDYAGGLLEEDAVGAQGNSYGGLSKATLSGVPAMQNWRYDVAGQFGQNGRVGALSVINNIDEFRLGDDMGCVALATQNGLTNAQRVMQPYMRYTNEADAKVDLIGPSLYLSGRPLRQTSHLPTAGANTTNDPISVMFVDLNDIYPVWLRADTDGFFGITDFIQHSGSHRVFVAYVDCNGAWWIKAYHTSGILFDGETFAPGLLTRDLTPGGVLSPIPLPPERPSPRSPP